MSFRAKAGNRIRPDGWGTMRADGNGRQLLLLLFGGDGGLGGLRLEHALLEFIDASGGIDEFLLASVKGMANVTDADDDDRPGGAGLDHVAAGATDFGIQILRMNVCFHKRPGKIPPMTSMTRMKFNAFCDAVPRERQPLNRGRA